MQSERRLFLGFISRDNRRFFILFWSVEIMKNDTKFNYFKKLLVRHLDELEEKEKTTKEEVKKSIIEAESIRKAGYPVGTVREWKGKKYIKVAPKKWRPKYDSNSRGAKLSIAAIKRKADKCTNSEELLQLILENRDRFSDDKGRPLPFVKELSDYVSGKNDALESVVKENLTTKKQSKKKDGFLNDVEKVKVVKKLDGDVYHNYETDANKFAIYAKDGKAKGLAMTQDIADIINSHNEASILDWQDAIAEEIHAKYPKIEKDYVRLAIKPIRIGYKNGKKENVMIIDDSEEKDNSQKDIDHAEQAAKTRKEVFFEKETERLMSSGVKSETVDAAIKSLEKHIDWINYGIPQDETDYEKARREGETEATQSIIDKLKQGNKEIVTLFVKEPESKNELDKRFGEKSEKSIKDIREKYEASKSVIGNKRTVTLPDGTKIKCHYKIVEADAPTASHDEKTFAPSEGFPTTKDGKNVNDRDYQNDTDAQESVRKIANNFNSLALESPPIVTKDGIVISGNNRTMSSKLAAKMGTDKAYLQDLTEMSDEYGIEPEDLNGFNNPRLILEVDEEHTGDYTTEEFAQFNRDTKKTMNNVEKAVKLTKTLDANKIQSIAESLQGYDTMGELYVDTKGSQEFVNKLITAGIIGENEKAQYCHTDGTLNDTGKDFCETVLVGGVLNEDNIRKLDGAGGKRIRQKLVRAILPLIENKGTDKEYSFNSELNEAVDIAATVAKDHRIFPTVKDYLAQRSLFGDKQLDVATKRLAELIHDESEKAFAQRMKGLGAGLRQSASGEQDIFLGGVESKESLLARFLDIKKSISDILSKLCTEGRSPANLSQAFLTR